MSDSRTTATPETTNATPTDHPPVRVNQREILQGRGSANEIEVEQGSMTEQRVMRAIGGGSPAAPPKQFAEALGGVQGRSQAGLWRQMQRGYGNNYVGKVIQAKLTVNQPGDIYEQEADRMATQVMAMPQSGSIQREMEPKKEKEKIQMKPSLQVAPDGNQEAGGNLEGRLNNSKGGGSPLPDDVRSFMEPRFEADFSQVRVHTGSESVQMNQNLNAQAFTHRQDVYFGAGKTPAKDALTAHELTHVVQQSNEPTQGMLQRQEGNNAALAAIEKKKSPMYALLPELNELPKNILDDEQAGNFVGGSRFVLAMRVVKSKDVMQWNTFVQDNSSTLSILPNDQVLDICNFLDSKDAHRWYIQEKLHKKFESADSIEKADWNKLKQEEIDERVKAGSKEGTTGTINDKAFVVYLNEIKVIQSTKGKFTGFSWLCNNPGSLLKDPGKDKIRSIGNFERFFIFPTFETGRVAARRNILDGKGAYPDSNSIFGTMKTYASAATDNPDAYADTVIRELKRVNSLLKDLKEPITKNTTTLGEVRKAIEKHQEYLGAFYDAIKETEGTTNRINQGAILKRGGGIEDSAGVNITGQEKKDLLLKLE